ncbi:MAG: thioesterase family protein [Candidatus Sericytochromatia bacterium]|nr:thioesterase family protein [Candidatus Sericytochromatia bacterium]
MESVIGISGHADTQVDNLNTAVAVGSGALPVFATSAMLALMEQAAVAAVGPHLPLGTTTVGTGLHVKHLAATPLGHHIQATATLHAVEGQRLTFNVAAFDEKEKIGEGTHERFVVHAERFLQRISHKQPVQ